MNTKKLWNYTIDDREIYCESEKHKVNQSSTEVGRVLKKDKRVASKKSQRVTVH